MSKKAPKTGKENEVVLFYPEKRTINLKDMTTEQSYKLDAIPKDRNSRFTTRYLNVLQDGEIDDSAKWSVADRMFAILQYGTQQSREKNRGMKAKFTYDNPCRYCGKEHEFTFDYSTLFNVYKAPPEKWPVESWNGKELALKPITGECETLIEFQESQYWDDKQNDAEPETIEHADFQSELEEHNNGVFMEIQFLRVSAHTGISVDEQKAWKFEKFNDLLLLVQKHLETLNYGIQLWKNEQDHINNPGLIEHWHKCPEPDEEYMEKTDKPLLESFRKGGLDAIQITLPFRSKHCT